MRNQNRLKLNLNQNHRQQTDLHCGSIEHCVSQGIVATYVR